MKTYTHPTINLPAGAVVVKFFDPDGTGTETTPKIIEEIGDVEDGFDINLGEFWAGNCTIKFHNENNYVSALAQLTGLSVSILVDNELYFLGDIAPNDAGFDVIETSSTNALGTIEINFINRLAKLSRYPITNLGDDIDVAYDTYIYMSVIFQYMAAFLGLKSAATTDVDYIVTRLFSDNNTFPTSWFIKNIVTEIGFLKTSSIANHYSNRLDNAYDLLAELSKDFFFYPSMFYDGVDYKLIITERDCGRVITAGSIKDTKPSNKYFVDSLHTFLGGAPDGFNMTDLEFNSEQTNKGHGDKVEIEMHHTNIIRNDGTYYTNMLLEVFNQSTLINYIRSNGVTYTSLQNAIHTAYKNTYFDNFKWRKIIVKGLKGTYSSVSRMYYLMPSYILGVYGRNHLIHSVKKSLMKNESELSALDIGAA